MALGLFRKKAKGIERTPAEVAKFLEDFLNGSGPKWEWDDFLSTPLADPELEKIRERCGHLDLEFPPATPGAFTSDRGLAVIRSYADQLRQSVRP
jgi:hypothetical protein